MITLFVIYYHKMKLTLLKVDFYLQLLLVLSALIGWSFNEVYSVYAIWGLAIIQSISIVYHSVIVQTKSTSARNFHYGATAVILIFLFLLYFSVEFDLEINEIVLPSLMIISFLSIIMVLLYFVVTYKEILKWKEENEKLV